MTAITYIPSAPITDRDKQALAASAPRRGSNQGRYFIIDEEEEKIRIRESEALTLGWANRGFHSVAFKITDADRKPPREVVHVGGDPFPGQPRPSCMTPEQITRWNKIVSFLMSKRVCNLTPKVYMAIEHLVF